MESKETFTAEEIKSLIEDLGIEVSVVETDSDEDLECRTLQCELGEIDFRCYLYPETGEVERFNLGSSRPLEENPFKFVNFFNSFHPACSANVAFDDEGNVLIDDDGDFWVVMRALHLFNGGVTTEHLQFLVASYIEDLKDFLGIEEDEEVSFPELSEEVEEMNITQQIEWALGDKVKRSARELAGYLMLDRHDINSALYKNKDMFVKDAGQPPRWTLNS